MLALACTNATGGVSGGDPLTLDPCAATGNGHTWSDLYTCYFGPTAQANCSAQSFCHGTPSAQGSTVGLFLCGNSKDECWRGTQKVIAFPDAGPPDPNQSTWYLSLRGTPGAQEKMPCNPQVITNNGQSRVLCIQAGNGFAFQDSDLARIGAWITEGAQNN
jgi:hypothetical protein